MCAHLTQQLHAVLAPEPQIEQYEVDHLAAEGPHQLRAAARAGDAEIILDQVVVDEPAHRLVVIDDEHVRARHPAHCRRHP